MRLLYIENIIYIYRMNDAEIVQIKDSVDGY